MGLGVNGRGEPVPQLVRGDSFAQIFTNFFGDVVAAAVSGEAAGEEISCAF